MKDGLRQVQDFVRRETVLSLVSELTDSLNAIKENSVPMSTREVAAALVSLIHSEGRDAELFALRIMESRRE